MKHDPTLYEPPSMFCEIGSLIGAGASLIGGAMASDAAGDAADAQVEAARLGADVQREGIDFSKGAFDISRSDLAPYRASGGAALGALNEMFIPGGQSVVRLQGRLGELRARRAVLDSTLDVTSPVQQAAAPAAAAATPFVDPVDPSQIYTGQGSEYYRQYGRAAPGSPNQR